VHHQKAASYLEASGIIRYNMTNDYMFRYILQKNQKVLKDLICSLLHLKPHQIRSIEILNPINLAEDVSGKDFILDINILLNNQKRINLEMQVINYHNWQRKKIVTVVLLIGPGSSRHRHGRNSKCWLRIMNLYRKQQLPYTKQMRMRSFGRNCRKSLPNKQNFITIKSGRRPIIGRRQFFFLGLYMRI